MKKRKLLLSLPLVFTLPIISIACSEPWDKNKHTELENFEKFVEEFPKELNYFYAHPYEENFTPKPNPRKLTETDELFEYSWDDFRYNVDHLGKRRYHDGKKNNLDYTRLISSPALLSFSHEKSYFRQVYDNWNYLPTNGILNDKKYSIGFIIMVEYQYLLNEFESLLRNVFFNRKHEYKYSNFLNNSDYEKNEVNFKEWTKFIDLEERTKFITSKIEDLPTGDTKYTVKHLLINIRFGYRDEDGRIRSKKDYLKYIDLIS
ncbi:hypothetical protein BCF89_1251 [Metamycoplasma auris]|uniref:Lipoprotein n=2 Tax=Metamycoplasma auris TaxID=51363 RepID=A0A2W7FYH1_9BACT|nr:hypothetical protein BCF89_1251 [Metamycoplasma auris]